MQEYGGTFKQKPIRTLALFVILLLAILGFLLSIFHTTTGKRKLPAATASTHDRALRGKIISKDGYTLSRSSKTYQATLFTQSINPDKKALLIKLFSIYSNIDEDTLKKTLTQHKGYTVLAEKLDAATAIRLKALAYKLRRLKVFHSIKNRHGIEILYGLDITENGEERSFPLKDTLSPVLGYVKNKEIGKYTEVQGVKGLERSYEKRLNSINDGFVKGMRDVSGTIIRNKSSIKQKRQDGMNIHLNISLSLQRRIELLLDQMKQRTHAKEILIGIMESHTGNILALASSERYEPNHIQQQDLYNLNPKFSEFLYEPGSVMKPITLAIAIEHQKVSPDTWFDTARGKLKISEKYTISDDEVFESQTATDIIVHSSNVGISKISWKLTGDQFYQGLKKFGFGSQSGIDLSRELVGQIKTAKQLHNKLNRASQSYGYGMMASFVQLWKAYSAFNNQGIAVTPKLVSYLQSNNGKRYLSKPLIGDLHPISKETAKKMKKILKKVVSDGTGKAARYLGLEIGGKTGTAHIVEHKKYIDKYNSSFFGFANDNKGNHYTIGVLAIRLHKKHMHFASQSAVPTFKQSVSTLIELGYLKPDLTLIQKEALAKEEYKRHSIAKRKQQQRTREIKKRLKEEREEIKRKHKKRKKKKKKKKRVKISQPQKAPTHKSYHTQTRSRPTPHEAIPDLF